MALSVTIKKQVGDFKLDVAFETDREILALLGASGCGKSMTLKCIAGIEKPDSGRIVLHGRTLFDSEKQIDLSPQERRVGYLFQDYALFPDMTVEQNIMAGVRGGTRKEKRSAAREKIRAFGLDGLGSAKPAMLSGGQKQRVALARILINQPEVLLLDEPFTALDSSLKWQLELELSDTLKSFPNEVVFVSHNRDEVYRLCRWVCVLTKGRSEEKTTVPELFEKPGTVSAARITGCKNISSAVREEPRRIFAPNWGVSLATGDEIPFAQGYAGIRSKSLKLAETGGINAFPCQVHRVIEEVDSVILVLKPPGDALLHLELTKAQWEACQAPSVLTVSVDPAQILLLSRL